MEKGSGASIAGEFMGRAPASFVVDHACAGAAMMGIRKITPGGHEYLVGRVACGDRDMDVGETLADYYFRHGYPPGQWFGSGAAALGMTGEVDAAQMQALFGEGRHPDTDRIEARLLAGGAGPQEALKATKLGNRQVRGQ